MQVMVPTIDNSIKTVVMKVVAAIECVELYKTWMMGMPVCVGVVSPRTLSCQSGPRQKHSVMSISRPRRALKKEPHIIAEGRTREASFSSSDI